jgi:hypothetical protein
VRILLAVTFLGVITVMHADDLPKLHLFVALADNAHQGIVRVPAKIGNGDDPANNLYWGCSEGLKSVFSQSATWKLVSAEPGPKPSVLERLVFTDRQKRFTLTADAYRGEAIKEYTADFFAAISSSEPSQKTPLVAYIGHDGLMDFSASEEWGEPGPGREAIVLCCLSEKYFGPFLRSANARPLLTTTELMYPGAFILHAALEGWMKGESVSEIRERAAVSYARNQKIGVKAARSVFSSREK